MDNKYIGEYELKIRLADVAWSNDEYLRRIESGELENLIKESSGVFKIWKGVERKYQNVPTLDSLDNALSLIKKLDKLPYVCELTLSKVDLNSRIGYIPVKD